MPFIKHSVLVATWLALCLPLASCESFDPSMLTDWIPTGKKSLPGDRQPVFPQGVPGVSDGVPPELIKGNQPAPEAQAALPEEPPQVAEKPKPKPKPKPKKVTSQPSPRQQQGAQPQSSDSPWPTPQPAQPAQSAQPAQTIWPAPPPPGTFSR